MENIHFKNWTRFLFTEMSVDSDDEVKCQFCHETVDNRNFYAIVWDTETVPKYYPFCNSDHLNRFILMMLAWTRIQHLPNYIMNSTYEWSNHADDIRE